MKIALELLGGFVILASLLTLVKSTYWWIRILDFPRVQVALLGTFILGFYGWQVGYELLTQKIFAGLLVLAIVNELVHVYRFTPFVRVQALKSKLKAPKNSFGIMISNVRMSNKRYERFLKVVRETDPDLLLINEPNHRWAEAISELDDRYPYCIKEPLENTYGMIFYSKFKLAHTEVRYLVEEGIPSFYMLVELPTGKKFDLFTVHPQPPHLHKDTDTREAELLTVAQMAKESPYASIVIGDLNDVAWSYTTNLFRKISGLLDPRIGRGFFNTYNAFVPFFRYSLDHIFYDPAFRLIRMKRLPFFGSDHFPMFIRLNYEPLEAEEHEVPEPDAEEKEDAQELMDKVDVNTAAVKTASASYQRGSGLS
ncbi:endonuclease/exonuclease/phosphatase family protein [Rufibacter glacialis]|uniref:Endonuclease/exonuclease/phosphatase family protein n=1 Tax=Rufibacter glacialis TaxID=1259555 RepID=A0A5M8QRD2_9BACT|nr:endonuclease/exonuclease/phosphatase family protein [Rufibacter glacialis]KAA6437554.1 endonuclease/exonuclease/phosphatase family protein [Rufibacter glacialis]GGK58375.1 endonuclease [Rufibacter glacialis]